VASVVDIEIRRANQRTAALAPRGMISTPLGGALPATSLTRHSAFSRRFPLSIEEGSISADQLEFRLMGEAAYQPADHLTRVRSLALSHHQEQVRRTARLFEVLAAQSILTGFQDAILGAAAAGDTDHIYDFVRLATHTFVAPGGTWTAPAAPAIGDMETGCDLIRTDASVTPDFVLLGRTAMDNLTANTQVLALAASRRANFIGLGAGDSVISNPMPTKFQRFVDGGWIYRGYLETPSGYHLSIFTYLDTYVNAAGVVTPYMPLNDVLLGSSEAICDRYFGPPERLPLSPSEEADMKFFMGVDPAGGMMPPKIKGAADVITPAMFSFDFYKSGRKTFTVETQSAPLFVPTMTDAWVTIDAT
jgi:hypothetical protein